MRVHRLLAIPVVTCLVALAIPGAGAARVEPPRPHVNGIDSTAQDAASARAAVQGQDEHSPNARRLANIPRSSEFRFNDPAQGGNFQSDLAFKGNLAVAGNYNGFRVIDIKNPARPKVVRDVWCPGPQNDVSIWGDAIVLSVDTPLTGTGCTAGPAAAPFQNAWEGLRIFSLKQILAAKPSSDGFTRVEPKGAVYTDCGSHTHTGIPAGDKVLLYVASYPLRSGPTCGPRTSPTDPWDPLHKKISIVEMPLTNPAGARLLKYVPVNVPTWNLLPAPFNPMQGCHDFQVYPAKKLAAAACSSVGQLWDISDPRNPRTLSYKWQVDQPQVEFYHSAAFTWDGKVVIFGDESINQTCDDGSGSGRLYFHDAKTGRLLGTFNIPRKQGTYCSAHLFQVLKTARGYRLVASWYTGGVTVVDFTNPAKAKEIAYYDPALLSATDEGLWSAYPYNGFVYSNGYERGFDSYLIGPAIRGARFSTLNPQTQ
ncbi:LVIVD repeat-containing protein [Actinomadura sp. 6N118]|uniref:LVIVD repeat-containing protein n=1 Tax=Actinomadura sp. 6N118 TaxID=3375151 RepID=UPI00379FCB24